MSNKKAFAGCIHVFQVFVLFLTVVGAIFLNNDKEEDDIRFYDPILYLNGVPHTDIMRPTKNPMTFSLTEEELVQLDSIVLASKKDTLRNLSTWKIHIYSKEKNTSSTLTYRSNQITDIFNKKIKEVSPVHFVIFDFSQYKKHITTSPYSPNFSIFSYDNLQLKIIQKQNDGVMTK